MPSDIQFYDMNDPYLDYALSPLMEKLSRVAYIGAVVNNKIFLVEVPAHIQSNYKLSGERTGSFWDPEDRRDYNWSFENEDKDIYEKACTIMSKYDLNPFQARMFYIPQIYHASAEVGAIVTPKKKDAFLAPTPDQIHTILRCVNRCDYIKKHILEKIDVIKTLETWEEKDLAPYFQKCIEANCFKNKEWVDTFIESCNLLKHKAAHLRHDAILQLIEQAKTYCNLERVLAEDTLKSKAVEELNKLKAIKLPGAEKYCPSLNFVRQYTFVNFIEEVKSKKFPLQEEKPVQAVQTTPPTPDLSSKSSANPLCDPPPPYEPRDAANYNAALEVKEAPEVEEINSIKRAIGGTIELRSEDGRTIYFDDGKTVNEIKVPKCIYKMFKEITLTPYEKKPALAKDVLENIKKRAANRSEDCRTSEQIEFCNKYSGNIVLCPEAQILMDFKKRIEADKNLLSSSSGLKQLHYILIKNLNKFSQVTDVIQVLDDMKNVAKALIVRDDYTASDAEMIVYFDIRRAKINGQDNNATKKVVESTEPTETSELSVNR